MCPYIARFSISTMHWSRIIWSVSCTIEYFLAQVAIMMQARPLGGRSFSTLQLSGSSAQFLSHIFSIRALKRYVCRLRVAV